MSGGASFASDVAAGLLETPKRIPPRWFYDALGTALFEAITCLPWYPITRAECRLLERHGGELADSPGEGLTLVELGPGGGEKLALFLSRASLRGAEVHLVDLSPEALAAATRRLERFPGVRVACHALPFEAGLHAALAERPDGGAALVLFLGSNIGNLDLSASERFLGEIRSSLRPGDALLLGADLVKPERDLLLAYDDPLGVTAAFNRNLLVRMNRELGAAFDLDAFAHRAVWNAAASRVEMWLVARRPVRVAVPAAGLTVALAEGEGILTEWSHKYEVETLRRLVEGTGFSAGRVVVDEEARFALSLFRAA